MKELELIINGVSVDLDEQTKIQIDKIVDDFRDATKRTGTRSLPFTLPLTSKNKKVFGNEQNTQVIGKFKAEYSATLLANNIQVLSGLFRHQKTTTKGFEGGLGVTKLAAPKLGDILSNKKLTEIKSFSPIDFSGTETISDSWYAVDSAVNSEICYPYIVRAFNEVRYTPTNYNFGLRTTYEDLGISHFTAAIMKNIITDAGYTLAGDILTDSTWNKLFLLYSNAGAQAWNYGKLVPLQAYGENMGILSAAFGVGLITKIERDTDNVYALNFPVTVSTGDLCESMKEGVYTAKFTGEYNFTVKCDVTYSQTGGTGIPQFFNVFRCITDDETIPETLLPGAGVWTSTNINSLDAGTLAIFFTNNSSYTFSARLTAGKQYQLQRYYSVPKPAKFGDFFYSPTANDFRINSCNGSQLVNPALFLPEMSQAQFVSELFKIFNIICTVNEEEKLVTMFTRDQFFSQQLTEVIDISSYVNLEEMTQTPFLSADSAKTYLTWAADDSDYILKNTDYMSRVNGVQPDGTTQLSFAPIGFLKVRQGIGDVTNPTYENELLPAIIPHTDSEDESELSSDNYTNSGSWTPRLALYHGNLWLRSDIQETVAPVSQRVILGNRNLVYSPPFPKITFFNVTNQPAYSITVDLSLKSFKLELLNTATMYNPVNTNFLMRNTITELDYTSLATNTDYTSNPKSLFNQLYSNDLLISSLSNYSEGVGRINPVLFNRITGRQTIRINQDLFLMDSIKSYDIIKGLATYKVYKLISNERKAVTTLTRVSATATATVSCGAGYYPATATATVTIHIYGTQAEAIDVANKRATAVAQSQLYCVPDYS